MSFKEDFFNYLETSNGIVANVPGGVHSKKVPSSQKKSPYIIIQRIDGGPEHHMEGASGITDEVWQVDIYSRKDGLLDAANKAVTNALDGFQGFMETTDVRMCHEVNTLDDFVDPVDKSQEGFHRTLLTYDISYFIPIPTFT